MIQSVKKLNHIFKNVLNGYEITTTQGEKMSVPIAEDNTDYQNILKWVAEGNTIEEAD